MDMHYLFRGCGRTQRESVTHTTQDNMMNGLERQQWFQENERNEERRGGRKGGGR